MAKKKASKGRRGSKKMSRSSSRRVSKRKSLKHGGAPIKHPGNPTLTKVYRLANVNSRNQGPSVKGGPPPN